MTPSTPGTILLIGNDTRLAYLIERYLESSGLSLETVTALPPPGEVCTAQPAAALFLSVQSLEASPALIADLQNCDVPLLVFSSVADRARAHDLGFAEASEDQIHFLYVDGYNPNRSQPVAAPQPTTPTQPLPTYDDSFTGWLQQQWDSLVHQFQSFTGSGK